MFNSDLIEPTEELYFNSYKDFEQWLEDKHGDAKEFISPVINVMTNQNQFINNWKLVDRFQSGNVMYRHK